MQIGFISKMKNQQSESRFSGLQRKKVEFHVKIMKR